MAHFIFRCPATSLNVQHQLDDDPDISENKYEGTICPACTGLHFINRKTGKVLGQSCSLTDAVPVGQGPVPVSLCGIHAIASDNGARALIHPPPSSAVLADRECCAPARSTGACSMPDIAQYHQ